MMQLSLPLESQDETHGFPDPSGEWLHISQTRLCGYAPTTLRHRTFKDAIRRAMTLLNESPQFFESIEVKRLK
jgi:hypothetical protein